MPLTLFLHHHLAVYSFSHHHQVLEENLNPNREYAIKKPSLSC